MEYINSTTSRKLAARDNMRALEKAINEQDVRIALRKTVQARASIFLGVIVVLPFSCYFLFNIAAPHGVMQNYKASSGAYLHYMQTFLYRQKSLTETYRPEIALKE